MGVCVLYACREVTAFLGLPCPFSPRDPVSHNFHFSLWFSAPNLLDFSLLLASLFWPQQYTWILPMLGGVLGSAGDCT